jgi:hypothetical protein
MFNSNPLKKDFNKKKKGCSFLLAPSYSETVYLGQVYLRNGKR